MSTSTRQLAPVRTDEASNRLPRLPLTAGARQDAWDPPLSRVLAGPRHPSPAIARGSWAGIGVTAVAAASSSAGVIHLAAVGEYWSQYRIAALFFIALATFQLLWAALMVGRPSRNLYVSGIGVSVLTVALWVVTRTAGLPFGPYAGVPEKVGRCDLVSTLLEEFIVVAIMVLAWAQREHRGEYRHYSQRQYRAVAAGLTAVTVGGTIWALALMQTRIAPQMLGISGGTMSVRTSGNMLAMMATQGGPMMLCHIAVGVFALYLVAHIRREGWPSFSWRLDPSSEPSG